MQRVFYKLALCWAIASGVWGAISAGTADAYSTPSGLNPSTYPSVCPPRPSDESADGWTSLLANAQPGANSNISGTATTSQPGGGPVAVDVHSSVTTDPMWVQVGINGSSGFVAYWTGQAVGQLVALVPYIPAGKLEVFIRTGAGWGAADLLNAAVADLAPAVDDNWLGQALADSCYRREQLFSTQHSDLGAIDTDVQAVTTAVNGLKGTGSPTLSTLDIDLKQLDADLKSTLSVNCLSGCAGSGGTGGVVQLSSADRQLQADIASQNDGDLWVLCGVVVGCYAAYEVLKRVLP